MLWWMVQNTLAIGVLAMLVALACRIGRFRPAVQHVLWLVVMLKFLTPSFVCWPWSVTDVCDRLRSPSGGNPGHADSAWANDTAPLELATNDLQRNTGEAIGLLLESAATSSRLEPDVLTHDLENSRPAEPDGSWQSPGDPAAAIPGQINPSLGNPAESSGFRRQPNGPEHDASGIEWPAAMDWLIARCARDYPLLICSSIALVACLQLRRLLKSHQRLRDSRMAPAWLARRVCRMASKLNVREPRTVLVPGIASPFVWCIGRARLLWPESLAADRASMRSSAEHASSGAADGAAEWADRWEGVIAHELAHLRRRDHWVAWLELAASCVWWWNPLFWFVRRRVRESAELACDAWAVWSVPNGERAFAESLLEVTRLVSRTGAPVPALGVSTGARRSFERRLTMILCERVPCKLSWRGMIAACILKFAICNFCLACPTHALRNCKLRGTSFG